MPRKGSRALLAIRIAIGVFFIFEGLDKVGWLASSAPLTNILRRWAETGTSMSRWYIETIALPGAPVFARLVFVGEVAAGLAFLSGRYSRPAAVIAFLMVLQIHFAHSSLFHYSFLSQGDGLPVLGCLLALALAD